MFMTGIPVRTAIFLSAFALGLCCPRASEAGSNSFVAAFNTELAQRDICASEDCDTAPRLLSGTEPQYPTADLWRRTQGHVVLEFEVLTDGSVSKPRVRWSNSQSMRDSALRAMAGWQFAPAEREGHPVALTVRQSFRFRLGSPASASAQAASVERGAS